MTTTTETPTPERAATPGGATMSPMRKTALIAESTTSPPFVLSIPVEFGFWTDVLDNPDFILGPASSADQ